MHQVLVVDDVQENITLLTFDLEDEGYHVIAASSGEACLHYVSTHDAPAIILLDINMPGIGGIETLRRLKDNSETADIPVIVVSASDDNDTVIQAIDMGAHDFVYKPIQFKVLAARMRSALRLSQALSALEGANIKLKALASTDPLTSLYNRRHFFFLVNSEIARMARYQRRVSVMMIDIDYFKRVNDNFGHAAGDIAIKTVSTCISQSCRTYDIIGRLGGEEFAICSPDTDIDGAQVLAERIRQECQEANFIFNTQTLRLTVSIGITEISPQESLETTLHRADALLYKAKENGRNCCIAAKK